MISGEIERRELKQKTILDFNQRLSDLMSRFEFFCFFDKSRDVLDLLQ